VFDGASPDGADDVEAEGSAAGVAGGVCSGDAPLTFFDDWPGTVVEGAATGAIEALEGLDSGGLPVGGVGAAPAVGASGAAASSGCLSLPGGVLVVAAGAACVGVGLLLVAAFDRPGACSVVGLALAVFFACPGGVVELSSVAPCVVVGVVLAAFFVWPGGVFFVVMSGVVAAVVAASFPFLACPGGIFVVAAGVGLPVASLAFLAWPGGAFLPSLGDALPGVGVEPGAFCTLTGGRAVCGFAGIPGSVGGAWPGSGTRAGCSVRCTTWRRSRRVGASGATAVLVDDTGRSSPEPARKIPVADARGESRKVRRSRGTASE
jgi:hypothetical protein